MRRSKLEVYLDILNVLANSGPMKLTLVMYKTNVNCTVLEVYLDFLLKQGLVEEKIIGKERKVYVITQHGVIVLKQFRELKEILSIVQETEKADRSRSSF